MILYFSAEGNSLWIASLLARRLSDRLLPLTDAADAPQPLRLAYGEALGLVFPCYGWDVPQFVNAALARLRVEGVDYVWACLTCGDDTGLTAQRLERALAARGWALAAAWALRMPETYVCLPGMDTDSPAAEERKLQNARRRAEAVAAAVAVRRREVRDCLPGRFAWMKTCVLGAAFRRWLITPKPFRASGRCTRCGRCAKVCPRQNIALPQGGRPVWGNDCIMCLRCYHHCPAHAVEWGRMTRSKGQYLCRKPEEV